MRKWSLVVLVGLLAVGVWAQAIDVKDVDLSKAKISLAGPDRVYITSVLYKGQEISIHLVYDGKSGATFTAPYTGKDKALPDSTDLRYASIKKSGADGIMVSDVIIGNAAYSGIFRYNPSSVKLELFSLWSVPVPANPQDTITALKQDKRDLQAQVATLEDGTKTAKQLVDFPYEMDLGFATLKVLGKDGVLISRVVVGKNAFAGVLKFNQAGNLVVESVWGVPMPTEEERIDNLMLAKKNYEKSMAALAAAQDLPGDMNLDFATLKKMGNDSILVERVLMGGQAYSGVLTFNADNKLALSKVWTVPMPADEEKISAVRMENKSLKQQLEQAKAQAAAAPAEVVKVAPAAAGAANAAALPKGISLADATLSQMDDKQILVENIAFGGKNYSGVLAFRSDNSLAVTQYWASTPKAKAAPAVAAPAAPAAAAAAPATDEKYTALQLAVKKLEDKIAASQVTQNLPYGLDFSQAALQKQGSDSVLVSRVVLGDRAYAGVLTLTGDNKLAVSDLWEIPMPAAAAAAPAAAADRSAEIAALQAQIRDLQKQVADAKGAAPQKVALPAKSAYSGFGGAPALGEWKVTASGASQQSAGLKYAKYAISLNQNQPDLLYEFTGKAPNAGWVGFGLHFLVSGETTGRGYGYGQSYLVWITRDPAVYKTESAFVQLYQSFDDVQMVQLASTAMPDQIDKPVKVQAFYSRTAGAISVVVNGVERLRFALDKPLTQGSKIALRTLGGPVEFSDVSVKTY